MNYYNRADKFTKRGVNDFKNKTTFGEMATGLERN